MYEIGVVAQFEAAHRLVGDFGPATRLHGHTYRLEVTLSGARLDESQALFDVGKLDGLVNQLVQKLHFQDLDQVPGLSQVNTTAEAVARFCFQELAPGLTGQGLERLAIRVWESPRVFAGYSEALS